MNIERFAEIVTALQHELDTTESPAMLRQLAASIDAAVQQPGQAAHQQEVSDHRAEFRKRLSSAPSNDFSPAWAEALNDLGVAELLGAALSDSVDAIFLDNEMTLAAASQPISERAGRLEELASHLKSLAAGFEFFGIQESELAFGDYEIGFLMPRELLAGDLERLGQEFVDIKRKILGPLLEVTSGSRPEIPVRSIASSEFEVFLSSYPALMIAFVKSLDVLLGAYERLLDIRLKHRELRDAGVPEEAVQGIASHAEGIMSETIEKLVDDLLEEQSNPDSGRANELRRDLTRGLNALANRIDKGYTVEIRAGELPEVTETGEDADSATEDATNIATTELVLEKQQRIRFKKLGGTPILKLEETTERDPPR